VVYYYYDLQARASLNFFQIILYELRARQVSLRVEKKNITTLQRPSVRTQCSHPPSTPPPPHTKPPPPTLQPTPPPPPPALSNKHGVIADAMIYFYTRLNSVRPCWRRVVRVRSVSRIRFSSTVTTVPYRRHNGVCWYGGHRWLLQFIVIYFFFHFHRTFDNDIISAIIILSLLTPPRNSRFFPCRIVKII